MKKILPALISLMVTGAAHGQEPWTMDMCIEYAVDHAFSVEQAKRDLSSALSDKQAAAAEFFPSFAAQTGAQFSWGRSINPETNTYANVTTFNNGYAVYASLTLFDGGQTINRWRNARTAVNRSRNIIDMNRDECAISAMLAFVDAVYYKKAIDIAANKAMQSEATLNLTFRQMELGIKGEPDVAQAKATFAADEYNRVQMYNMGEQANLALRSAMNYPQDAALELDSVPFEVPKLEAESTAEIYSISLNHNPHALDAEYNVKSMKYQYEMAKGALWPTISLNAGISTSYFKNINDGGTVMPSFSDQFRNNRGEYVAATISIPLFDNLYRVNNKRKAKNALENAITDRDEKLRKLHDDISRAILDRDGYAAEIISLSSKVEADERAYELNKRKYEEGLLSLIDLQISANTLYESRLSLLQKQMLYILKQRLINYYKGEPLWTSK